MAVSFDAFVEWAEDRLGDIIISGDEIKANSIFMPDTKHHLAMNVKGGVHEREDGCYRCFYSGKIGTLVGLVMEVDGCSYKEAKDLLCGKTPIGELEAKLNEFFKSEEEIIAEKPKGLLSLPEECHLISSLKTGSFHRNRAENYLKDRKIPINGLYFCTNGVYKSRIVIPYYDKDGILIYFNSRHIGKSPLRYRGPPKSIGVGKCLGENTPVLMYDGRILKVQDIKNEDLLIGPDSNPRIVKGTTKGFGKLFKVIPVKGDSYVVNEEHILSLYDSHKNKNIQISVKDYFLKKPYYQKGYKGYRCGIEYPRKEVLIDPYILGIWLGDGHQSCAAISNIDQEIIDCWYREAKKRNLRIYVDSSFNRTCFSYYIRKDHDLSTKNTMLSDLRKLNLLYNKHIPNCYLINDRNTRLNLLAGYLDTDGSLSNNCYDFITKHQSIAEGITFLARSLGLACYCKETYKKSQKGTRGLYYRGCISGNTNEIPLKIKYKKATERKQKKNVLHTGIKIISIGYGNYYGFKLSSDHLFLLGDFTVTHNSDVLFALKWPKNDSKIYLTEGEFDAMTLNECGFNALACGGKSISHRQINFIKEFNYEVCLALDNDETVVEIASPGLQGMMDMGNKLIANSVKLSYVQPPKQFKDWNKMYTKLSKELVQAYIEKCEKPYDSFTNAQLMAMN